MYIIPSVLAEALCALYTETLYDYGCMMRYLRNDLAERLGRIPSRPFDSQLCALYLWKSIHGM